MTMSGQLTFAELALAPLGELLAADNRFLITHGNGPQVGYILTRVEAALGKAYSLPLEVCVAESEGEIGYVLQQTLYNLTQGRRPVATLLTQVVVDADDPAFLPIRSDTIPPIRTPTDPPKIEAKHSQAAAPPSAPGK